MSRWETTSTLAATVPPAAIWERAYADAEAWPKWNAEIKRATEDGHLFTDESRLPVVQLADAGDGRAASEAVDRSDRQDAVG